MLHTSPNTLNPPASITNINNDVLAAILADLDGRSLATMRVTCRALHQAVDDFSRNRLSTLAQTDLWGNTTFPESVPPYYYPFLIREAPPKVLGNDPNQPKRLAAFLSDLAAQSIWDKTFLNPLRRRNRQAVEILKQRSWEDIKETLLASEPNPQDEVNKTVKPHPKGNLIMKKMPESWHFVPDSFAIILEKFGGLCVKNDPNATAIYVPSKMRQIHVIHCLNFTTLTHGPLPDLAVESLIFEGTFRHPIKIPKTLPELTKLTIKNTEETALPDCDAPQLEEVLCENCKRVDLSGLRPPEGTIGLTLKNTPIFPDMLTALKPRSLTLENTPSLQEKMPPLNEHVKVLSVQNLPNLTSWGNPLGLNGLVVLELSYCPRLTALPDLPSSMRLKKLSVRNCKNLKADSAALQGLTHLRLHQLPEWNNWNVPRLRVLQLTEVNNVRGLDLTSMRTLTDLTLDLNYLKHSDHLPLPLPTELKKLLLRIPSGPHNITIPPLHNLKKISVVGTGGEFHPDLKITAGPFPKLEKAFKNGLPWNLPKNAPSRSYKGEQTE